VSMPWVLAPLIDSLLERGQVDEAAHWLGMSGIEGELPQLLQFTYLLDSIGRLRIAQLRTQEGAAHLRECGARLRAWGIENPGFVPWRSHLALALATLEGREEAVQLCDQEIEAARAFGARRELGMALRAKGLVVGGDDGTVLLQEAVAALETSPARLEHARALTDLGAALRRSGHRADAREPLRLGLDLASRCGATALMERAHAELVAAGARPRRALLSGVQALTASELRVCRMAATGLNNRQIAEALFVTEKTVEGHLGNAYRKLDLSSRTDLPRVLDETATGE
jgi:DNA-binding CsgD family transcriptional regulator